MKLKIVLAMLFSGTVIAGCGSTQNSTRSDADSTTMDSGMRQTTTPVDTMQRDTTTMPTDTMKRDTLNR
ncbi:MAG: hypothetical protein H7096_10705 [Flavobacterium sp.]|nr:hypothetical protein [Pedobacter sp.]